jgi:hypothetical protein
MQIEPTWKPFTGPADTPRSQLPDSAFAFPAERSEPLTDAAHVRSAIARFGQVRGVTETERDVAFKNIEKAAAYYDVVLKTKDRHES